ncbi:hypothetical protein J1N35_007250 [Gossypium stocksii]|uniref:Uncharacterized protein n=1 Tax=Gossypium stocksii TaxID=47602 RepID=A0A9D3W6P2_9ROSI|nr:hypothetical protein J1N35_007250 [Gossypium stocksii]
MFSWFYDVWLPEIFYIRKTFSEPRTFSKLSLSFPCAVHLPSSSSIQVLSFAYNLFAYNRSHPCAVLHLLIQGGVGFAKRTDADSRSWSVVASRKIGSLDWKLKVRTWNSTETIT